MGLGDKRSLLTMPRMAITLGTAGKSRPGRGGMGDTSQNGAGSWQRVGIWQGTPPGAADGATGMWLHPTAPSAGAGRGNGAVGEAEQPRAPLLAPRKDLGETAGVPTPGMSLGGLSTASVRAGAAPCGCTSGSTSGWGGSRGHCLMSWHHPAPPEPGFLGELGIWELERQAGIQLGIHRDPAGVLTCSPLQQPESALAGMRALKFRGCLGGSDGWAAGRGQGTQRDKAQKAFVCACAEWAFSLPVGRSDSRAGPRPLPGTSRTEPGVATGVLSPWEWGPCAEDTPLAPH